MKHLSDDELQLYLSGNSGEKTEFIEEHLERCTECRRQLAVYKSIDTSLGAREDIGFGHDFDDAVIQGIHNLEKKPNRASDLAVVGFALAGIVGIFLFFFFSATFRDLFVQGFNYMVDSAKVYTDSSGEFSGWLKLAPAAFIVVLCYGILDRLLVHGKRIKSNLMFL